MNSINDIYIKDPKNKGYLDNKVESTTFLDTVIGKIYVILMTNKGDVLGDPDFGADIPKYLWKTSFPASTIESNIKEQFMKYIPELMNNDYKINVYIMKGTISDIGVVQISLGIAAVNILYK